MTAAPLLTFASAGAYGSLQKYLVARYADAVVLTFAQIEDLVGFPLPHAAWVDPDWWRASAPGSTPSAQWQSWTLAKRRAAPNLPAETVLFERMPTGRNDQ
jgi:hypothetical protein